MSARLFLIVIVFFLTAKEPLKMELALDVRAERDQQTTDEPFTAALSDLELALVGGGIGDVVPA
jgi:hypothetical protein